MIISVEVEENSMKIVTRRFTAILLVAAMLFTFVPAVSANAASYLDFKADQCLVVTAPDGVNMHDDPSVNAERILILACGTHVTVNSIRTNGWMNVTCGAYTGWVEGTEGWFNIYQTTPTVYDYTNKQAVVLANALNVHSAPIQTASNIIDDLSKGQAVDAAGYTANGWTKVRYYRGTKEIVGYVSSIWIRLVDVTDTTYSAPEEFTEIYGWSAQVKSNCSALNVHASPSVNSDVITEFYAGDVVSILAESGHWYRVSFNYGGQMMTGYIYKSYTKVLDAMENLRLNKASKTLRKGKKFHILVRGNTGMSLAVTWKSSNKKVAKVNKRGYVTAKKKGNAVITCTIRVGNQKKILKCNIKVK